MSRDLSLLGPAARANSGARLRAGRAMPPGYGLLIGAAISLGLWTGAVRLILDLLR